MERGEMHRPYFREREREKENEQEALKEGEDRVR